jgi:hypothetical protein
MGTDIIPIETVGADIAARISAGDKAMSKADEHYLAAGIQLLAARTRLQHTREMRWSAFLFSCCKGLSSSRAYELINIAEGKTTPEEIREKARVRKQRFEARNREARDVVSSVRNGKTDTATAQLEVPPDSISEVERLNATIADLRERLAKKDSQCRVAASEAAIATRQRDEAQNRAMFAEAEIERLTAELADAKAEISRLRTDPEAEFTEDQIPAFLKKDAA